MYRMFLDNYLMQTRYTLYTPQRNTLNFLISLYHINLLRNTLALPKPWPFDESSWQIPLELAELNSQEGLNELLEKVWNLGVQYISCAMFRFSNATTRVISNFEIRMVLKELKGCLDAMPNFILHWSFTLSALPAGIPDELLWDGKERDDLLQSFWMMWSLPKFFIDMGQSHQLGSTQESVSYPIGEYTHSNVPLLWQAERVLSQKEQSWDVLSTARGFASCEKNNAAVFGCLEESSPSEGKTWPRPWGWFSQHSRFYWPFSPQLSHQAS